MSRVLEKQLDGIRSVPRETVVSSVEVEEGGHLADFDHYARAVGEDLPFVAAVVAAAAANADTAAGSKAHRYPTLVWT
jgi:hypothetical protein